MEWKRVFLTALLLVPVSALSQDTSKTTQRADSETGQAVSGSTTPLTNQDVLDMLHSGLSSIVVVAKIKAAQCQFDTTPKALEALKVNRVPDNVVLAMVQAPDVDTSIAKRFEAEEQTEKDVFQSIPACGQFKSIIIPLITEIKNTNALSTDDANVARDIAKNLDSLNKSEVSCYNEPRAHDAIDKVLAAPPAQEELLLIVSFKTALNLQTNDYQTLVNKYNNLVDSYNQNLSYVRSIAYRLSLMHYFTTMFQRPVPQSLDCTTSAFGDILTTHCN